jgi:hypothetical protein
MRMQHVYMKMKNYSIIIFLFFYSSWGTTYRPLAPLLMREWTIAKVWYNMRGFRVDSVKYERKWDVTLWKALQYHPFSLGGDNT